MIVYKTTNLINGKFYIGQDSKNNPNYLGSGTLLKRAIKTYGRKNFIKEIIEICETKEQLNEREIFWINETNARIEGYNIAEGGRGGIAYEHSVETIQKRKETRRKRMEQEPDAYKHSEETKKIIGSYHKNKIISEAQKLENSKRMKNFNNYSKKWIEQQTRNKHGKNNFMFGKTHSCEAKQKMSISRKQNPISYWKNKNLSEIHKKNISLGLLKPSFKHTEEHKKSITGEGNPFYGHKHNEETKKKMSEARRSKTPEQKLERYIKFYISRCGNEPPEEQKLLKLEEYKKC